MQPQDNNFPMDDIANNPGAGSDNQQQGNTQPIGGDTFQPQPQAGAQGSDNAGVGTTWQQETSSDVAELYAQPDTANQAATPTDFGAAPQPEQPQQETQPGDLPQSPTVEPVNPMPAQDAFNPTMDPNSVPAASVDQNQQYAATPEPQPMQPVQPEQNMPADPNQPTFAPPPDFSNLAQNQAQPIEPQPDMSAQLPDQSVAPNYPDTTPQPNFEASNEAPLPAATPQEPYVPDNQAPMNPNEYSTVPQVQSEMYSAPNTLPGSEQLGDVAGTLDNSGAPQYAYPTDTGYTDSGMPSPVPQPAGKGFLGMNKKLLFIIGGAIIGLIIIIISIILVSQSSSNSKNNSAPTTNTNTENKQQTVEKPASTTPAATPPAGYVTIEKQCYSFALYEPNTVPTDNVCTFEDATFGKKKESTISVITGTENYNNLKAYADQFKGNVTVVSEKDIKLDIFDAKQIIYKDVDGKTYSAVLALIVGKNYQQEQKPVTSVEIKTLYQGPFDQEVTANVLDTWRWK